MLTSLKEELSSIGKNGEQSPDTDSDKVIGKVVVKVENTYFSFTRILHSL